MRPGYRREVHYVESSPADQLQPKHTVNVYAKPGDALALPQPVIFDVGAKTAFTLDNTLVPQSLRPRPLRVAKGQPRRDVRIQPARPSGLSRPRSGCRDRARSAPSSPRSRRPSSTTAPPTATSRTRARNIRYDLDDGREVIWMSERDGWNHLYLMDGATGQVKRQITRGEWVVRAVVKVDEAAKQILFSASGMNPGKDPYFLNLYRINFDGSGPDAADHRRRQPQRRLLRGRHALRRHLVARRRAADIGAAQDRRRQSGAAARERRHRGAAGLGLEGPGSLRRQRAATDAPTSGA